MNEDKSFIVINRKILKWGWYDDINTARLFIHLLLIANWEDKEWHGEIIKRGQVITGRKKLSKETKLSEQQVRTSLTKLISTQELTIKKTNKYSVITINNYNKYQDYKTLQYLDDEIKNKLTIGIEDWKCLYSQSMKRLIVHGYFIEELVKQKLNIPTLKFIQIEDVDIEDYFCLNDRYIGILTKLGYCHLYDLMFSTDGSRTDFANYNESFNIQSNYITCEGNMHSCISQIFSEFNRFVYAYKSLFK